MCMAMTCAGRLTLVADLGQFALESDTAKAKSLPIDEASLYECLKLQGSNISAYLVDGDFSFSALEEIHDRKAPAPDQVRACISGWSLVGDPVIA